MLRDLFFRIKARDDTATAFAKVKAGLKGVEGAVSKAEARIRRAGAAFKTVLAEVTSGAGGIAAAFQGSIEDFDASAQAQAKVANAVKATGGAAGFTAEQLGEMASALQRTTRFEDDGILDGVIAQMLTFTNVTGPEFERAAAMTLDVATQLGSEPQAAAIMLGKALNDPARGLTALRKVGIQFTADQQAVIKSLVETGRTAEAQRLILDELGKQGYGGQAAAAAQVGLGPVVQLQNAFGDLKEVVGAVQSEALLPLVGVAQSLVQWFAALPEPVQRFAVILGTLAVVVVPLAASIGILVLGLGAISMPVLAVVAAVAAATAAIVAFWPEIKTLGAVAVEWFGIARDAVVDFAAQVGKWFAGSNLWFGPLGLEVQALGDLFALIFPDAAAYVEAMVVKVKDWLGDKLAAVFDAVTARVRAIGDAFYDLWDRVVGHSYVPDLVDGIGAHFGRLETEMVAPAIAATDTVGGVFDGLGQGVGSAIRDMVESGEFTFRGFADRMIDTANRMAGSIVDDAFAKVAEAAQGLGGSGGIGGFLGTVATSILGGFGSGGGSVPAFATGGDMEIGGRGGVDRNLAVMKVSKGETVSVAKRGAQRTGSIVVNISTPSPAAFEQSRGQVAATISRAVARGSRNL